MNIVEFKQKINIDFLNEHIAEMISYNVPFPIAFIVHIRDEDLQQSIHRLYYLKAKEFPAWYEAMKRVDEGDMPYYDYSYKKTIEYCQKMPQFKELLR